MDLSGLDLAIVDHLDQIVVGGYPRPAELAKVPKSGGWEDWDAPAGPFTPYLTVWPASAERVPLLLARPNAFVDAEWTIKGASLVPAEAKRLVDAARDRLLHVPVTPPAGLAIVMVRHVSTSGPYPDHDTVPELYVATTTVAMQIQTQEP